MGKGMDWIPCYRWGLRNTVASATQFDLPLFRPTQYDTDDVVGSFEDTPGRYFIHRIVGVMSMNFTLTPAEPLMHECIWPGLITDPTLGFVGSAGFIDEGSGANSKLWWRRTKAVRDTARFNDLDSVSNPWHFSVDIQPKSVIQDGQIPLYSIFNPIESSETVEFWLWLRILATALD